MLLQLMHHFSAYYHLILPTANTIMHEKTIEFLYILY